jgi:hypothetical protein
MGTDAEDAEAMRRLRQHLDEIGSGYREAIVAGQYGRAAQIASYVVTALAAEVPPELNAAHDVILNLTAALQENLAGKTTHPIIAGRLALPGIEQLGFKGVLIWGLAVAGVLFLEDQGYRKEGACKAVSAILEKNGMSHCGLRTVKNWRRKADDRQVVRGGGAAGEWGLRFRGIIASDFAQSRLNNPLSFLEEWISGRVGGISATLP